MVYFVTGLSLLGSVLFWGVGLAWWITPSRWRAVWPCWIAVSGFTLQSAVVWAGAWLGLAGTRTYATESMILPLVLLVGAVLFGGRKDFWQPLQRSWGGLLAMVASAVILLIPLALANAELTTVSLGSCDAADYAAGTRTFLEFSRSSREGLLGLTEVVRLGSCDSFFDFWLRLNHFTPSAVSAMNAALFNLDLHEVTGVMTIIFWIALLPSSFFLSRVGFRWSRGVSWCVATMTVFSPVSLYAVGQVAMAQLLATSAIAFLTAVGLVLWRHRRSPRKLTSWPSLLVVYSLLLGAYNFILLVAWTPAAMVVFWDVARRGRFAYAVGWAFRFFTPLGIASVLWWDRAAGIAERFRLFQAVDFGWQIPLVTPEGWWGAVSQPSLESFAPALRATLLSMALGLWMWGWLQAKREARRYIVLLPLPVLGGYAFLQVRGLWLGNNASYDAYKILSVFLPVLLAAWGPVFCSGRQKWTQWLQRLAVVGAVVAGIWSTSLFVAALRRPPFSVTLETAALRALEARTDVQSLNMQIDDFWTRLWANAFLLRKPQYFPSTTYEGRNKTDLLGSNDLQAFPIKGGDGIARYAVNAQFALSEAGQLRLNWGDGWYAAERSSRSMRFWRWSAGRASIVIDSRSGGSARLHLVAKGISARRLRVLVDGTVRATVDVDRDFGRYRIDGLTVPQGRSIWTFESELPPEKPNGGDARRLAFALSQFELQLTTSPE